MRIKATQKGKLEDVSLIAITRIGRTACLVHIIFSYPLF